MPDTSTLRCPFKIDTTTDQGITCETTDCAAWVASAGECMLLQMVLAITEHALGVKTLDRGDFGV